MTKKKFYLKILMAWSAVLLVTWCYRMFFMDGNGIFPFLTGKLVDGVWLAIFTFFAFIFRNNNGKFVFVPFLLSCIFTTVVFPAGSPLLMIVYVFALFFDSQGSIIGGVFLLCTVMPSLYCLFFTIVCSNINTKSGSGTP